MAGLALAGVLLGAFTIGIFLIPVGLVLTITLACMSRSYGGWPGVLIGPALLLGLVGVMNWGGPGDVCTTTATSQECTELSNPWPFLVIAAGMIAGAVTIFVRLHRAAKRHGPMSSETEPDTGDRDSGQRNSES